jgi:hypothetical protein
MDFPIRGYPDHIVMFSIVTKCTMGRIVALIPEFILQI